MKRPASTRWFTWPTLKQLLETAEQEGMDELAKIRLLHENLSALMPKHILIDDIVASISYLLNLALRRGSDR